MITITGGGAFTRQNINDLNSNFTELLTGGAIDLWVRPQQGNNNTADGSYDKPFATMAGVSRYLEPGIVVGLEGVLFEEFAAPVGVNNVTIIGNQYTSRQATTSGVANGGGATWLSPSGGTGALLKVRAQGWTVKNVYFNCSATANPCIYLLTDGDPPTGSDAAHFLLQNCILTGTDDGIHVSGGTNFVKIIGCKLFGFAGAGDVAISQETGAGVGTLLGWEISDCDIYGNASNIVMPFNRAVIKNNRINSGSSVTINLTGGTAPNYVQQNVFNIAAADFDPAGGVTGVSGDAWSNYLTDAIETGLPAN